MIRAVNRSTTSRRDWAFELDYLPHALGSVMVHSGQTRVLCACSVEERQPSWMTQGQKGWVKAEYAMLPCSTASRSRRDHGNSNGRNHEIQRLIGRSLRGIIDLEKLGPRTLTIDCDVIIADAGTRTASITGGWIALVLACWRLKNKGLLSELPITDQVAAISLGIVDGEVCVDLDYSEDSRASTDLNLVMTAKGGLIEVQGTAEEGSFSRQELNAILDGGWIALQELFDLQRNALDHAAITWPIPS